MIYMSVTQQQMVTHPTSSNLVFPITVLLHADWMRHVEHILFPSSSLDLLHDLLQDYSIFILSILIHSSADFLSQLIIKLTSFSFCPLQCLTSFSSLVCSCHLCSIPRISNHTSSMCRCLLPCLHFASWRIHIWWC